MNQFSIKDIELLTGVKSHTLRIWEQRYGIPQPKRTATNIRYYDDEDLKLLLNVSMLNRQGHKISRLTKMSKPELEKLAFDLALDTPDTNIHIDSLVQSMFRLDEAAFEKLLTSHLLRNGLESTMINIFFPFLYRIGILWQTGQVSPAFEHFMSNLIRQKIIVAIDSLHVPNDGSTRKFILFLPENESHELGLLFANYLIRVRGGHTLYLGQNLPDSAIENVNRQYHAGYILTIITTALNKYSTADYISHLSQRNPEVKILISGSQVTTGSAKDYPENVSVLEDFGSFIKFLDKELVTRRK